MNKLLQSNLNTLQQQVIIQMEKEKGQYFGIKAEYLKSHKFEHLTEKCKRGAIIYDNFCQSLEQSYLNYKGIYDSLYETVKVSAHQKNPFVKEFKQFLSDFSTVLKDVSVFQVDCLTEIRAMREDDLDEATDLLLDKLDEIKGPQDNFTSKQIAFSGLEQELKQANSEFTRDLREPVSFYNEKYIQAKKRNLQQTLEKLIELETELSNQIQIVTENSKAYENYLHVYRKKLFTNKYHYLTRLIQMSKSAKNSLTEFLILLNESVRKSYNTFEKMAKSESNLKYKLKKSAKGSEQDTVASQIISMTQQYNFMLQEVDAILNALVQTLSNVGKISNAQYSKHKSNFLENLTKLYEIEQSPTAGVLDSLDLLNYFTQKLTTMNDKLFVCSEELLKLKQNVKKHSDITLSLLKCGPYKSKVLQAQSPNNESPKHYNKINDLMEQMSFDFLNAILQKVYKIFLEALAELKNYFNSKYYKKKKNYIEDSMEISHIEEDVHFFSKKPAKHELWLWSEWKNQSLEVAFPHLLVREVQDNLKKIKFKEDQGKLVEKFNCLISARRDHKGILKIMEKQLQFGSADGSINLRIPLVHIESVEAKVRIFEKVILISTEAGEITLGKFMVDVREVKQAIQRQIEEAGANSSTVQAPKRLPAALSTEQQSKMSAWRQKVLNSVEKIQELQKIDEAVIQNVTIDHVYQMVFSDKPVNIKGKEYSSTYVYVLNKNKSLNVTGNEFRPPGPKFYTGNESITFQNSPLFSQRTVEFDIPLPPIPFMPKTCHNKEVIRIYWISNEEFDCICTSKQAGAPYVQYIETKVVVKVRKQGSGVKIQMSGRVIVLQDFTMRTMIVGKAWQQTMLNCKKTLQQQKRFMNSMLSVKSGGEGECDDQKSTEVSDNIQLQQNPEMDKLKLQNKVLIAGFAILIALNVIFNLFFKD